MMHDLGCTCGRHFRRPLFHVLDVTAQPGLRYAVLAGVLNVAQCPSCERSAVVGLPFIYSDEVRGHLFQVYPDNADGVTGEDAALQVIAERSRLVVEGEQRPAVMRGTARLVELIDAELDDDEQPGIVVLDVRPGIRSERAARLVAGQIAAEVGGYVHSWREGGRLHLHVLGPTARLETITVVMD